MLFTVGAIGSMTSTPWHVHFCDINGYATIRTNARAKKAEEEKKKNPRPERVCKTIMKAIASGNSWILIMINIPYA